MGWDHLRSKAASCLWFLADGQRHLIAGGRIEVDGYRCCHTRISHSTARCFKPPNLENFPRMEATLPGSGRGKSDLRMGDGGIGGGGRLTGLVDGFGREGV